MYRPLGIRGELVITTRFGVLSAQPGTWALPIEALILDLDWIDLIGLACGPYCMTDEERELPF